MSIPLADKTIPIVKLARRTRVAALTVAVVAILAFGISSITRPAGSAVGTTLDGSAIVKTLPFDVIRIGTFNVHGGVGTDGRFDPNRLASEINAAKLDVVALQEVQAYFTGPHSNTAAALGAILKIPHLFAPTERRWWRDDFGNGVLCALPVERWTRTPIPSDNGTGYRNFVHLRIRAGAVTLNVLLTHIDRQAPHDAQLSAAAEEFLSLDEPAVMLGDLNTRRDHPVLQGLLSRPGVTDAIGPHVTDFKERIDWVITRGLRTVEAGVGATGASDHPLVWAAVTPR